MRDASRGVFCYYREMKEHGSLQDYFYSDTFAVKRISQNDVPEVINLINHAFWYQDEAKGAKRIDAAGVQKKMDNSEFYVWRDGAGELAACCYVTLGESKLHFGLLAITDKLRGKGLAPAIMTATEGYGQALGKEMLELDYMSLSPWLGEYYERYGFEKTGFVEDIGWSKLIQMQKKLS